MKYKADIGRCTIAKHPVELELGAVPHREGARRTSPKRQNVLIKRYVICSHWDDSTLPVTLGKWDSHGQEKEWRVTLLL